MKVLKLVKVKLMYDHKAFTVIEMILVLFITSLFAVMSSSIQSSTNFDSSFFEESVLHTQWLSLWSHTEQSILFNGYSVAFSRLGNVIKPGTFTFSSRDLIVSLGTGRIYEKSQHTY